MNMSGNILGVSAPMFTSVASGLTLLALTAALFWMVLTRKGRKWAQAHRMVAWALLAGVALHGAWGVVAVFVLKS